MAAQPNQSQPLLTPEVNLAEIFIQAANTAELGSVHSADLWLEDARKSPEKTGIRLSEAEEARIVEITQLARIKAIGVILVEAAYLVRGGYSTVDEIDTRISEARKYAVETERTLTNEQEAEIAEIQKLVRVNAVRANIAEAANLVLRGGSVGESSFYINLARGYAAEAVHTLTPEQEAEIAEIQKLVRVNAVRANIAEAAKCAGRGNPEVADTHISSAREYAKDAEYTLTREEEDAIVEITQLAKVNAVGVYLSAAASVADLGSAEIVNGYLDKIHGFAAETGIPLTEAEVAMIAAISSSLG